MARITVHVDSAALNLLHRQLRRMPENIQDGIRAAVEESAETIRDEVKNTVGVHTGRLRERVRVREIGDGTQADVGWFDDDTYYAQFVEFGTSKITANPVLTRAGEAERKEFPRRVRERVRERL